MGQHKPSGAGPDRQAALAQYRMRAARYDAELMPFEPIRHEAIAQLRLSRGQTVIDAGCGTGLSFPALQRGVGEHGRIIGIELCPEMIERARERCEAHGWRNVELVCDCATRAKWRGRADAVLLHFTHDVVRDEAALDNLFAHLKPGARVVSAGLQWGAPWALPVNAFVMLAAMYSVTSFDGLGEPWSRLARRLTDVQVRQAAFGGIYIASGVYPGPRR